MFWLNISGRVEVGARSMVRVRVRVTVRVRGGVIPPSAWDVTRSSSATCRFLGCNSLWLALWLWPK